MKNIFKDIIKSIIYCFLIIVYFIYKCCIGWVVKKYLKSMDVIIPVHEKDLKVGLFAIRAIKFFSLNLVKHVYVVGNAKLKDKLPKNVVFVDELQLGLPNKFDLNYIDSTGLNRSGWLFQQFIKLSADRISSSEFIFILDADTIFLQPVLWIDKRGRSLLFYSDEYHLPYGEFITRVFPDWIRYPLSFVSHQILFRRDFLIDVKSQIEVKFNQPIYSVILDNCDLKEMSCFSEYELIGNYLVHHQKNNVVIKHWKNIALPMKSTAGMILSIFRNGFLYRSASFHVYK